VTELIKSGTQLIHFDLNADQYGAAIAEVQHKMAAYMREKSLRPCGPVSVTLEVEVEPE
jgi:hypothetical protein